MALHLTRRPGETVYVGPDLKLTIGWVERGKVGLVLEAPRAVEIWRGEILPADHPLAPKPPADPADDPDAVGTL